MWTGTVSLTCECRLYALWLALNRSRPSGAEWGTAILRNHGGTWCPWELAQGRHVRITKQWRKSQDRNISQDCSRPHGWESKTKTRSITMGNLAQPPSPVSAWDLDTLWYLRIAGCTVALLPRWAHGYWMHSTPSLLLPVLFPSSSFAAPTGVCLSIPFAVLLQLPVLLCAVCSSGCQGWAPVCFLLPPSSLFLPLFCLLVCIGCFSSCFPLGGCGWLSLFPPSFPSLPFPWLCVCETPNKTRHLSSDSAYPDQCLASLRAFVATDWFKRFPWNSRPIG